MNLILLNESDFTTCDRVQLTDRRLTHLQDVHHAKIGDSLRVGLINGKMGQGTITQISDQSAELQLTLEDEPPAPLAMTLILALPRPKMLRRILRSCAEFGIKQIYLINSYRVEKSYWQTPVLKNELTQTYLLQGLEQAKDTVVPKVYLKQRFKPFVEDELPRIIEGSRALLAHPTSGEPCPHEIERPVTVAIGPEGGFIPFEVEHLRNCGFETIHLGDRIYRVENAINVITAKLFN